MSDFKTVIYSRPEGVDVALDYALPAGASARAPAPILLWFHGGGLLQGFRKVMPPHIQRAPQRGLCVVSADYRLAPQTRLPGIMADIKACIEYLRSAEFAAETGGAVDQKKIVVSGGSAGGWLALLLASGIGFKECGMEPPAHPAACAAIYPITDITDRFWTTPQRPVSYLGTEVDREPLLPYLDPEAPKTSYSLPTDARSQMYHYMLQEGIEQQLLLGGGEEGASVGVSPASFRIAAGIGSGKFVLPPTYIIHGTLDDKVPPRQSEEVAHAAEAVGLPIELDLVEGADHLFDFDEGVQMDAMYKFIKSVL
ncbi:alpha/beta-hydrolase [Cutaneotrichosporon oleaginosum]|uniref:Alpha/beta-hydrolase n=1 Tax=Cutaneotrichosporon oleaginosum TaxID=879819 RepID=A0A0J0XZ69_9TREE|nr:alpha/beta-hydrolase [Cutaneotrichosporon oleaginosum]KLT46341.1 alpha/beta-hydrolase [Cutaneotrichosporon oleaginosum]TXT15287.1 hypothetical protein COLE_01480 [Cutaneotrichosporon oleaginosum]